MLAQMRQNTKIILWVVIVAFVGLIFVVWGMNLKRTGGVEAGIVGRVGGDRITMEEYRSEVANQRAAYYQDKGRRSGATAEDEINQRAWDTIVQNRILWSEVARENLGATSDEIFLELQSNPPAFIRSQPVFQTDSLFDHGKYLAALEDPRYDFRALEAYIRATLPLQKLQEYMSATVRVTDQEAEMLLAMIDERATVSYVRVSPVTDVRDVIPQPGESEIASYYSGHPDEFRVPERRKFRVVRFDKAPGEEDIRYATDRIQEALDLISEGEPFEEIAVEYSDDETTAPHGGDLGWVTRGRLSAVMDSAIALLEPGQVTGIITSGNSLHAFKVEDRRMVDGVEEAKLRHIIARIEASPSTIEQLQSDAEDFAALAHQKGIDKAAAEQAMSPSDSPELPASQVAGFFRVDKAIADGIVQMGRKQVSGVVEGSQAFYVIETVEIIPERIPPVEEIRERVAQAYVFSQKKDRARQIAEAVAADAGRGRTLEEAAAARNLQVAKAEPFTRTSNVPGIGKDNMVVAQAFVLQPGQISKAIANGNDFFVIRVEGRQPASAASMGQSPQQLRMALLGAKQQALLTDWYSRLLAQAEIKDHRSAQASGRRAPDPFSYIGY